MLAEMPLLSLAMWGLGTFLSLVLLSQLLVWGHYRVYQFFAGYLVCNLLQTIVGLFLYQGYGFTSGFSYQISWTTQAVVVVARSLAAADVCYLTLGMYPGIWGLAKRILAAGALLVLSLALFFGRHGYHRGVIILDIGLESGIATAIVGLFVFLRYYEVKVEPATRLLGMGLGLLSCFKVLNDAVVERFAQSYVAAWNYVGMGIFVGVLLIWVSALRRAVPVREFEPRLVAAEMYDSLVPQVNQRLRELNDELNRLWRG